MTLLSASLGSVFRENPLPPVPSGHASWLPEYPQRRRVDGERGDVLTLVYPGTCHVPPQPTLSSSMNIKGRCRSERTISGVTFFGRKPSTVDGEGAPELSLPP